MGIRGRIANPTVENRAVIIHDKEQVGDGMKGFPDLFFEIQKRIQSLSPEKSKPADAGHSEAFVTVSPFRRVINSTSVRRMELMGF